MADGPSRRRTFGPVVLVGIATGVVLAMAGIESWFSFKDDADSGVVVGITVTESWDVGVVSSANALALVALACWGVLLVTRGRLRRVIAVVGLLAALAEAFTVIYSYGTLPGEVRETLDELTPGAAAPELGFTGWFWLAAVAALLSLAAWVAAVVLVPHWPEMGHRYDTPADSPPDDLWKAMDQGHDPTS